MKNILILTMKYLSIMPDHETGWLVQIQSLRLYRGKLLGILGVVYYSTEAGIPDSI